MFLKEFENIKTFFPPCHPGEVEILSVTACCTDDIKEVFPFLNAIMKGTIYDPKNQTLHFKLGGYGVTLYPNKVLIAGLKNKNDAEKVLEELKSIINDTYEKRNKIKPSYKTRTKMDVLKIYKLLPRLNCGKCGLPTCMAFSASLISEEISIDRCTPLFTEEYGQTRKQILSMLEEAGYIVPQN